MTALTDGEARKLRKLIRKMISGGNGQQMGLFRILHDLDVEVHSEDNEATRRFWYQKWFELAFAPSYKMGRRTPRIGDKVCLQEPITRGKVVGLVVDWGDNRRTTITNPEMIQVTD